MQDFSGMFSLYTQSCQICNWFLVLPCMQIFTHHVGVCVQLFGCIMEVCSTVCITYVHACDHMCMHVFWLEQQVQIVNFLKSADSLEAPFGCNRQCTFVFSPLKSTATHFYLLVIHSLAFQYNERVVGSAQDKATQLHTDYALCQHISL